VLTSRLARSGALAALLVLTTAAQAQPLGDRISISLRPLDNSGYFFPSDVAAADLDADGLADVVVTGKSVAIVSSRSSREPVAAAPERFYYDPIAIGDFNEDGRPDLAVGVTDSALVKVLLHGPDATAATFGAPASVVLRDLAGVTVTAVVAADLDGDGHLDLATSLGHGSNQPALNDGGVLLVRLGRGDGTFAEPVVLPVPAETAGYAEHVAAGDLDGDGRPDLVLTRGDSDLIDGYTVVFLNRSAPGQIAFDATATVAGYRAHDTAVVDLDEDGVPDLVTTTRNAVVVQRGLGAGRFAAAETTPVRPENGYGQLWGVAAADLDLDGHLDLVVTHGSEIYGTEASSEPIMLTFLQGDGSGGLVRLGERYGRYGYYHAVYGVVATDLTGDGRPDVAFGTYIEHSLSLLLNTSTAPVPPASTAPGAFSTQFAGALDSYVSAVALDGDLVFVGGAFTTAAGEPARKVAVYDRRTGAWAGLGGGVDPDTTDSGDDLTSVGAIAVTPGYVYVAGTFRSVSGVEAHGLARYDRQSGAWEAIAGDFAGTSSAGARFPVAALAAADGGVYVGGSFRELPLLDGTSLAASGVAFFDEATESWAALAAGVDMRDDPNLGGAFVVSTLLPVGDAVYVGGAFNWVNGESAAGLARWTRATRSWAVPPGVTLASGGVGIVRDLRAFGGEVYAAGLFDRAGGQTAYSVARYRPPTPHVSAPFGTAAPEAGTWRPVGDPEAFRDTEGASELEDLRAIEVAPDGRVFVGGTFSRTFGGQTVEGLAVYDPAANAWGRVGVGLDREYNSLGGYASPNAYVLALDGSDLIVGGSFPSAGGTASQNLALYRVPGTTAARVAASAIAGGTPVSFSDGRADLGLSVVFTAPNGEGAVAAARLASEPLAPVFEGTVPDLLAAVRFVIEAQGGFDFDEAQLRMALADLFPDGLPENATVTVYRRPTPNEGTFQALPTSLDGAFVVAVTPGFSEFVVGASVQPATGVEAGAPALALAVAGPNPTAGRTALRLTLPAAGDAEVALYDVLGRRVATLAEGPQPAGTRLLAVDGGALAAGVYVARVEAGAEARTVLLTVTR